MSGAHVSSQMIKRLRLQVQIQTGRNHEMLQQKKGEETGPHVSLRGDYIFII